jgi:hypothetical protein
MKRFGAIILLLAALFAAGIERVSAQASVSIYCWNPAGSQATNNQFTPCANMTATWTPTSPDQHGLAITSSTALTVPAGSTYAVVCAKGGGANYTTDGATTPTGSVGTALAQNNCSAFPGAQTLSNLRFIQQTGSTTTLDVNYWNTTAYK